MSEDVIVEFDMWGQMCITVFNAPSELDPLDWLRACVEKGWLLPIEVRLKNGVVLFTQEQLQSKFKDV